MEINNGAESVTLINGVVMPLSGMGTYPLNGINLALVIRKATKVGVRLIDTATAYQNECWTGIGVVISSVKRKDMFITTKLSNGQQRRGDVEAALKGSLLRLGTRYVDLYLMHWPNPETYLDCWKQMEVLYRQGYARAIGVCNFHEHHLEELFKVAEIKPMVNQLELHPLLTQKILRDFCAKHEIVVEAYSPLARMHVKLIQNPVLLEIADRYDKSVPQIVLRWVFQKSIPAIPKSGSIRRIRSNREVCNFKLTDDEMQDIDSLNENFRVRFDPDNCDFSRL
jgi:methylglyoxal/glyoxal reductase